MSFYSVSQMAVDADLLARITACVAIEGERDPELWTQRNKWAVAGQPGWGDSWEYALNVGHDPATIGKDPSVITDQAILSAVQAINSIQPRR